MHCIRGDSMTKNYTLQDAAKIFPKLNPRTLQVWVSRGVIKPEIPSAGQGFPVRFSYVNLVEIGLVLQLVRLGANSHAFLKKLMEFAKRLQMDNSWIDGWHQFDCFLLIPETSAFGAAKEGEQDSISSPPFILLDYKEFRTVRNFFKREGLSPGWLLVNVRMIKNHVDKQLPAL
jgi:hypothetical protein